MMKEENTRRGLLLVRALPHGPASIVIGPVAMAILADEEKKGELMTIKSEVWKARTAELGRPEVFKCDSYAGDRHAPLRIPQFVLDCVIVDKLCFDIVHCEIDSQGVVHWFINDILCRDSWGKC